MFSSIVVSCLLVAVSQAREILQAPGVNVGDSCLRSQFPPRPSCTFECPQSSCVAPGRSCISDESDCHCKLEDGVILINGKCRCLREQYPPKKGCSFKCPFNSCIRPGVSCVDEIQDCQCNVQLGFVMNVTAKKCVMSPDFTDDFDKNGVPPTLSCKGAGYALDAETKTCIRTLERTPEQGCNRTFRFVILDGVKRCVKDDAQVPVPQCEDGYTPVDDPVRGVTCEKKEYMDPKFSCPANYTQGTSESGKVLCTSSLNLDPILSCDRGFVLDNTGDKCVSITEVEAEVNCDPDFFMTLLSDNSTGCVKRWWPDSGPR